MIINGSSMLVLIASCLVADSLNKVEQGLLISAYRVLMISHAALEVRSDSLMDCWTGKVYFWQRRLSQGTMCLVEICQSFRKKEKFSCGFYELFLHNFPSTDQSSCVTLTQADIQMEGRPKPL